MLAGSKQRVQHRSCLQTRETRRRSGCHFARPDFRTLVTRKDRARKSEAEDKTGDLAPTVDECSDSKEVCRLPDDSDQVGILSKHGNYRIGSELAG